MKRDKELIKAMMIFVEGYEGEGIPLMTPEVLMLPGGPVFNVSMNVLIKHGQLLIDSGLVKGHIRKEGLIITAITWEGYEFLDNARIPKIWNAATKAAGDLSWGVFLNVLTSTATKYATTLLEMTNS